jgi:release factor glutamine methyltransferase
MPLLDEIAEVLSAAGVGDPQGEAALIVAAAVQQDPGNAAVTAREMAERRRAGTPLPYVTGRTSFMGLEVIVGEGALIPREETELLGRTAIALLAEVPPPQRVIDMCCGSGNLACAIASACPEARVWASDLTAEAVAIARRNVSHLGLGGRVVVAQGDLFEPLAASGLEGSVDLVVCNPPYISSGKLGRDSAQLLSHEPREAFDGGPYGVSIFQRVIKESLSYLRPGGRLAFEIGLGQEKQVNLLFARANGFGPLSLINNAERRPRVAVAPKRQ